MDLLSLQLFIYKKRKKHHTQRNQNIMATNQTEKESIRLTITAKDDPNSGWIGVVSSNSCKEFKRVGILDLNPKGHVSLFSFAAHVASHLKNNYPDRTFIIEDCQVEKYDVSGRLSNLIMNYLKNNQ